MRSSPQLWAARAVGRSVSSGGRVWDTAGLARAIARVARITAERMAGFSDQVRGRLEGQVYRGGDCQRFNFPAFLGAG